MKNSSFSFNPLALASVLLIVIAMLLPWWSFNLQGSKLTEIYPYLIDGPGSEMIGYKRSPQMTLLTGVLIANTLIALAASVMKGWVSRAMLIFSGALTLLAAWRLLSRVAGVADRFHIPLQGHGRAIYEGFAQIEVWTRIETGLYLAVAGGILAIIAGLIPYRIRIGR